TCDRGDPLLVVLLFLLLTNPTDLFGTAIGRQLKLDLRRSLLCPIRWRDSEKRLEHGVPRPKLWELCCGRFLAALVPHGQRSCLEQRRHEPSNWRVSLPRLLAGQRARGADAPRSPACFQVPQCESVASIERRSERGV